MTTTIIDGLLLSAGIFVWGVMVGIYLEHHHPEKGSKAQRHRAERAEKNAAELLEDLNFTMTALTDPERALTENTRPAPPLTGGPGPARANRHGGLTVIPSPAEATAGQIFHLPTRQGAHQ